MHSFLSYTPQKICKEKLKVKFFLLLNLLVTDLNIPLSNTLQNWAGLRCTISHKLRNCGFNWHFCSNKVISESWELSYLSSPLSYFPWCVPQWILCFHCSLFIAFFFVSPSPLNPPFAYSYKPSLCLPSVPAPWQNPYNILCVACPGTLLCTCSNLNSLIWLNAIAATVPQIYYKSAV